MKIWVICSSLFLVITSAYSQNLYLKHYASEHGIPNSFVYQVLQDNEKYLWLCTNNGVSRFDGYEFKNFTIKDGLTDHGAFHMMKDSKGRLWFIPFNGKVFFYQNGAFHLPDSELTILRSFDISWMEEKGENSYCLSTRNGMIVIVENGRVTKKWNIKFPSPITHFYFDQSKKNIYLPDSTLKILDLQSGKLGITAIRNQLTKTGYIRILILKNKEILITANGIFKLDQMNRLKQSLPNTFPFNEEILMLWQDPEGDVWLSNKNGLFLFKGGNLESKKYTTVVKNTLFTSMLQDHEGSYWLSSSSGIFYIKSKNLIVCNKKGEYRSGIVQSIIEDQDNKIWIFEMDGSVKNIDPKSYSVVSSTFPPFTYTHNVFPTTDFFLIKSNTPSVFSLFSFGSVKRILYSDTIFFSKKPGSQAFCILKREGGMHYFTHNKSVKIADEYYNDYSTAPALVDTSGEIWTIGKKGIYVTKKGEMAYLGKQSPMLADNVQYLIKQKNGTIWAATRNHGIVCANCNPVFNFNMEDGIPSDNINHLYEDIKGNIWISTYNGAAKISLTPDKKIKTIRSFSTVNGLSSNEINTIYERNGTIWIGTQEGLNIVQENTIDPLTTNFPVYITSVNANSVNVSTKVSGDFSHNFNDIEINYVAISFASKKKINYKYRLLPIQKIWKFTNSTQLNFSSLPYGTYQFEVTAANAQNLWSKSVVKYSFQIRPAFWETGWFLFLIISILLLISIFIFRNILANVKGKGIQQRKLLESEMAALWLQMNPHFIFNSLHSIQEFILDKNPEEANKYLSQFANLMRMIIDQAKRKYNSLKEEINLIDLYISLEKLRHSNRFDFILEMEQELDLNTKIPSMLIQPVVENAIKYGIREKPLLMIRLTIKEEEEFIQFSIEDNGPGRNNIQRQQQYSDHKHKSIGLKNITERLILMGNPRNKTMIIEDIDHDGITGTKVTIFAPIQTAK